MMHGKKCADGKRERLDLIAAGFGRGVFERLHESLRGQRVGLDDLADACAGAWTASRICAGIAVRYPQEDFPDEEGLLMRMWA
jgi:predicted RNase H-like nuclease